MGRLVSRFGWQIEKKAFSSSSSRNSKSVIHNEKDDDEDDYPDVVNRSMNTIFNLVPQGTTKVVQRLGKFSRIEDPGFFFAIPIVDRIYKVEGREISYPIQPQSGVTKDNVSVRLTGQVYIKIVDPYRAVYGAANALENILNHAQSAMRCAVGELSLDEIFHNRTAINQKILASMSDAVEKWGAVITRYEITDVKPDAKVLESMDLQATSERKRREVVKNAEGAKAEMVLVSEGKKIAEENNAVAIKIAAEAKANASAYLIEKEASANAFRIEAEARAESVRIKIEAEAKAQATVAAFLAQAKGISILANELGTSDDAAKLLIGTQYIEAFSKVAGTNSSVIVPYGPSSDFASLLSSSLSIMNSGKK